jgi:hypothetical protein
MKAKEVERVLTLVAKWEAAFVAMRAERDDLLAERERLRGFLLCGCYDTPAPAPASEPE